jgi:hypothetical protein
MYRNMAALPHVEVELHARAVPRPSKRSGRRASQAALIKAEVGVIRDAFDEAIDGEHGRVEAVFGGLELAFYGRWFFLCRFVFCVKTLPRLGVRRRVVGRQNCLAGTVGNPR